MGTRIRPEVTKKSKYYLDKERYYELKHYCLQYPKWLREYNALIGVPCRGNIEEIRSYQQSRPTENYALRTMELDKKIKQIEELCIEADPTISDYLLKAICWDVTYSALKTKWKMPCSRNYFYCRYRKFFWLLDQVRG